MVIRSETSGRGEIVCVTRKHSSYEKVLYFPICRLILDTRVEARWHEPTHALTCSSG